jgi:hypothetical protein
MENTLFFGNGINRLTPGNISWTDLLNTIKEGRSFQDNKLPNTMIYERIILEKPSKKENIHFDEFDVKDKIAELMADIKGNEIYTELFKLNFQHYLTTNYDYAFIDSLEGEKSILFPIEESSTEDVYSIRRLKRIKNIKEAKKNFWQIHGEIRKPATIMLGLDHYCGSIGKIDSYIKGGYKYNHDGQTLSEISIEEKLKANNFNNSSWVELFFNSNLHIISFSLDYSELDLWWIINKRARMLKKKELKGLIKNEIHFHCSEIEDQKKDLLKYMNIDVHLNSLPNTKSPYWDYYNNIIKHFQRTL